MSRYLVYKIPKRSDFFVLYESDAPVFLDREFDEKSTKDKYRDLILKIMKLNDEERAILDENDINNPETQTQLQEIRERFKKVYLKPTRKWLVFSGGSLVETDQASNLDILLKLENLDRIEDNDLHASDINDEKVAEFIKRRIEMENTAYIYYCSNCDHYFYSEDYKIDSVCELCGETTKVVESGDRIQMMKEFKKITDKEKSKKSTFVTRKYFYRNVQYEANLLGLLRLNNNICLNQDVGAIFRQNKYGTIEVVEDYEIFFNKCVKDSSILKNILNSISMNNYSVDEAFYYFCTYNKNGFATLTDKTPKLFFKCNESYVCIKSMNELLKLVLKDDDVSKKCVNLFNSRLYIDKFFKPISNGLTDSCRDVSSFFAVAYYMYLNKFVYVSSKLDGVSISNFDSDFFTFLHLEDKYLNDRYSLLKIIGSKDNFDKRMRLSCKTLFLEPYECLVYSQMKYFEGEQNILRYGALEIPLDGSAVNYFRSIVRNEYFENNGENNRKFNDLKRFFKNDISSFVKQTVGDNMYYRDLINEFKKNSSLLDIYLISEEEISLFDTEFVFYGRRGSMCNILEYLLDTNINNFQKFILENNAYQKIVEKSISTSKENIKSAEELKEEAETFFNALVSKMEKGEL